MYIYYTYICLHLLLCALLHWTIWLGALPRKSLEELSKSSLCFDWISDIHQLKTSTRLLVHLLRSFHRMGIPFTSFTFIYWRICWDSPTGKIHPTPTKIRQQVFSTRMVVRWCFIQDQIYQIQYLIFDYMTVFEYYHLCGILDTIYELYLESIW